FDQFEEIFTLAGKNPRFAKEEKENFWTELSDLAENSIPEKLRETFLTNKEQISYNYKKQKVKIVFSFREEYLPEFESITPKIPSIKTSRFRLLPMNGHQALEVITKTWKENIKPTEAKKIVSYLTHESNPDIYELITIEPSLLSQVCAFIDKERMDEGLRAVSTELLDKYPPDKILSSIYNETIAAGSKAIPAFPEEKRSYNPLKKFLEEKMITAEGFRTKYSLTGKDEPIRPGVEILKEKYFLRQELNAIELTHDVLTPIIKKDREKRRKDDAFALQRKKTRRNVWIISLIALMAAATMYYLVTNKARADKKRVETMVENLIKDSTRLVNLRDSIDENILKLKMELEGLSQGKNGDKEEKQITQNADSLLNELEDLRDKFANLKIKNENDINEFMNRPKLLKMPKPVFYVEEDPQYIDLLNKYEQEKQNYNSLLKEFNELKKLFDDYTRRIPDPVPVKPKTISFDSSNSLKLNLYYSLKQNDLVSPPDNTIIYLIPYTQKNMRVIKNASVYEISCDESFLKEAKDRKTAIPFNGSFYFPDVKPGKYLVKICTYYGGYYTYHKTKEGMESLNWDASPPIR
ncbi:MAG TPA: hypothetical protein VI548_03465, partial [Chitinophagaceae bacterium]|nr:hypothetical protein [Chitinophagaceae bacterium]